MGKKIDIPNFRTEYNYDRNEVSDETGTKNLEKSMTKQEFAEDADINTIIERFGIGYEMPVNHMPPRSGDFTNLPDFTGAVKMVRQAQEVFNALPAKIRNRFQNEPSKYIEFFEDPDNYDEAVKLGLAMPRPPEPDPEPKPTVKGKKEGTPAE